MSVTATFTDQSTPGPSGPITGWAWDFGDGGTSASQNPTHTYTTDGTYAVTLTVTGTSPDGTASITKSIRIVSAATLAAAFGFTASNLTVTFTDQSTPGPSGPITAWSWDFGDGNTSTVQSPSHTYAAAGSYTVTLTVTGTGSDGTVTVTHTVNVSAAPSGGFGPWAWDAAHATVDSSSASKISDFLSYCGALTYFVAEVAVGTVTAHDSSAYSVSSSGKPGGGGNLDNPIWFPNGVEPGLSNDHHLSITDEVTGDWTDFEMYGVGSVPTKYYTGGKVVGWTGACSEDIDSVQAPGSPGHGNNSACAAQIPLQAGAITAAEVATGEINHTLVFSCNKPGPAPNPYPSASATGYPANTGHLPLGTWLRLNPSYTLPSTLTAFERMICVALQKYGMILRDQGSELAIHGTDVGGGGQGNDVYAAHGIFLNTSGGNDVKLSGLNSTVMSHLQVLEPPSP